jgi:hypothetical protein
MAEMFNDSTIASIEANLARDTIKEQDNQIKIAMIVLIILIFLFRGWFIYWIKFGIPVPSGFSFREISTQNEPLQINYTQKQSQEKKFVYKSLINNHKITIIPMAYYKLSGIAVATNHDFFQVSDFFDSAALYDLGTAWGSIGRKEIYNKYFKSYSSKVNHLDYTGGSRILWTDAKTSRLPKSLGDWSSSFSHSHLVPANRNIMAGLLSIKKWDKIIIEGELIDMEYPGAPDYHTSMSRNDDGMRGDRGCGGCETVYVRKVQVGSWIYK